MNHGHHRKVAWTPERGSSGGILAQAWGTCPGGTGRGGEGRGTGGGRVGQGTHRVARTPVGTPYSVDTCERTYACDLSL